MILNRTVTASLDNKEKNTLLANARNIDEAISECDFISYVESLIDGALMMNINDEE